MNALERAAFQITAEDAVERLLDAREALEAGSLRDGEARAALVLALSIFQDVIGPDLMIAALGTVPSSSSRKEGLLQLADRLSVLAYLTEAVSDGFDLDSVVEELVAIAHGDAPALFREMRGPKVKYREYVVKLRAVTWERFLERIGLPVAERQALIEDAYSYKWDTIRKWEAEVRAKLGTEAVEVALGRAEVRAQRFVRAEERGRRPSWRDKLKRDGAQRSIAARRSRGIEVV